MKCLRRAVGLREIYGKIKGLMSGRFTEGIYRRGVG